MATNWSRSRSSRPSLFIRAASVAARLMLAGTTSRTASIRSTTRWIGRATVRSSSDSATLPSAWPFTPTAEDRFPWGSMSIIRTRCPKLNRADPRLAVVVVLPTPPFWLEMAMMVAMGPPSACGSAFSAESNGRYEDRCEVVIILAQGLSVFNALGQKSQQLPHIADIFLHPLDEGIRPIEPLLAPEPLHEVHCQVTMVEVALKVQQVHLHQPLPLLLKGRAQPYAHRGGETPSGMGERPGGVHPVG